MHNGKKWYCLSKSYWIPITLFLYIVTASIIQDEVHYRYWLILSRWTIMSPQINWIFKWQSWKSTGTFQLLSWSTDLMRDSLNFHAFRGPGIALCTTRLWPRHRCNQFHCGLRFTCHDLMQLSSCRICFIYFKRSKLN